MADNERSATDVERLNHIRQEFERAENAGDPSVVDEYVAEDVVVMLPGQPATVGREASKEALKDLFAAVDVEVDYTSEEIVVGKEFAFDRGTASEIHTPKDGGEAIEHSANYLWLYRRTTDGDWEQFRVIANHIE